MFDSNINKGYEKQADGNHAFDFALLNTLIHTLKTIVVHAFLQNKKQ